MCQIRIVGDKCAICLAKLAPTIHDSFICVTWLIHMWHRYLVNAFHVVYCRFRLRFPNTYRWYEINVPLHTHNCIYAGTKKAPARSSAGFRDMRISMLHTFISMHILLIRTYYIIIYVCTISIKYVLSYYYLRTYYAKMYTSRCIIILFLESTPGSVS